MSIVLIVLLSLSSGPAEAKIKFTSLSDCQMIREKLIKDGHVTLVTECKNG